MANERQALGSHSGQQLGVTGLDTLGQVADTVRHALSIGADGGASYILNRTPLTPSKPDTARIYKFPGENVIRCDLNGDGKPDFVINNNSQSSNAVTVLLGTDTINKFDTVLYLNAKALHLTGIGAIAADFDSSGYESVLVFASNQISATVDSSHWWYYKGGSTFDTTPQVFFHRAPGYMAIGNVRDNIHQYLCEYYDVGTDPVENIYLYPLGKSFSVIPTDSIICSIDTTRYSNLGDQGGFGVFDVDGDGIDDILLEGYDNNYSQNLKVDKTLFVYKGGKNISPSPTYFFHRPFQTNSAAFGTKIIDVGNFTGRGYHSLLVTDPQANGLGGEVFLYNMGKALKDSCVAVATYGFSSGDGEGFGTQVAAPGDLKGDGRTEIVISSYAESQSTSGTGAVVVFSGDTSYGPVSVHELFAAPQYFTLNQNYPNPVNDVTDIVFAVTDAKLYGATITLNIYDMLGKKLFTAYQGKADTYEYTIRVDASGLHEGNYYYRLSCGGEEETKMMSVIR